MGTKKVLDKAIKLMDGDKVLYRIVGGHMGAQEFQTLSKAKAALGRIYADNLYKWQKQVPLTIWKDTYVPGKRFPNREIEKSYSVEELSKL